MRRTFGAALLALAVATSGRAQARPDTAAAIPDRQLFHRSDLYVAAGFALGTVAMFPLDKHLAQQIQNPNLQTNTTLQRFADAARFFGGPGPVIIGPSMYVVGRLTHIPHMAELGLHGTEALAVGGAITTVLKIVAGRARPDFSNDTNPHDFGFGRGRSNDHYKSFPSGHATMAFSAAAAVVAETHEWWPQSTWYVAPVMFGGATAVGLSRMYNNQHWASDVVMGAAIGTFAGLKTVRFNHTHTGNRIDQILLGTRIVPTPNGNALAWNVSW
ncbi:MAG TPA: phosphatase PAP2 family protein [Gemmatimonadaceae bacterium]